MEFAVDDGEIFTLVDLEEIERKSGCFIGPAAGPDVESNKTFELSLFNCLGDSSVKDIKLSREGFLHNYDDIICLPNGFNHKTPQEVMLFGNHWDRGSCIQLNLDDLFYYTFKELMILDAAADVNFGSSSFASNDVKKSFYNGRRFCVEFFYYILRYLQCLRRCNLYSSVLEDSVKHIKRKLKSLNAILGQLTDLPEHVYQYCGSSYGNKSSQSSYHLFHVHLDLRWLSLLIINEISECKIFINLDQEESQAVDFRPYSDSSDEALLKVEQLLRELFLLASARFNKLDLQDICRKSLFNCTCIQELWILIRKLVNSKTEKEKQTFWFYLNKTLSSLLEVNSEIQESLPQNLIPTNIHIFSSWFMYHISRLFLCDGEKSSNYPLLETILKRAIISDLREDEMRIFLSFIKSISIDLWESKPEPVLILWDYYQRRLSESFYIVGERLDACTVIVKGATALLTHVQKILEDSNFKTNSFLHFLRILGSHLNRSKGNHRDWNLIKGRVYSKLTLSKLLTLNQIGEYHVVSLFIILALKGDANQVSTKLIELFDGHTKSKSKISEEMLKGCLALAILLAQNGSPLNNMGTAVCSVIQQYADSVADKKLYLILTEAVQDIFSCNDDLSLGQHTLLDSWVSTFLMSCDENEAASLVNYFHVIMNRIATTRSGLSHDEIIILDKVWTPFEKYLNNRTACPDQVVDLAIDIAVIFHKLGDASKVNGVTNLFLQNESREVRLLRRFTCLLLRNSGLKNSLVNLNETLIKVWVRSHLSCLKSSHQEMAELTVAVADLPVVRELCSNRIEEIVNSEEPLLEFLSAVNNQFESVNNIFERQKLREKLSSCLTGIDKWLKPLLIPSQSSELIERVYFLIGNVFRLVSPLIYLKSKPNNLIQPLLSATLLPLSVYRPEGKIHPHILSATAKTLNLFIEGLLRLNPETDQYVHRILKDLICIYVPRCLRNTGPLQSQLKVQSFSLISLFSSFSSDMCESILGLLCNEYLRTKSRNPHPNAVCALMYIKEVINSCRLDDRAMHIVIKKSFKSVLSTYMMVDEKSSTYLLAKDMVKTVCAFLKSSKNEEIKQVAVDELSKLTGENLAWISRQVFDLLCFIATLCPAIVSSMFPIILTQIKDVEAKRGVGYDKLLRLSLERVEAKIQSMNQNN